ncbi:MAG: hypothetical protein LBH92_08855 [Bacteroidales bacterium]|jgi:hypothetical protein|nr:hypothetical protein [Bacteroidales bacterium]
MQELIVYSGDLDSYGKCDEILEHFLSVRVSALQVYRMTDWLSEELQEAELNERLLPPVSKEEALYAEVDGSMISARENGWKEIKLGRLFKSSDCLNPNNASSCLTASQYVGHFGKSENLCNKVEQVIESYGQLRNRLVFITDGATWIKNWIDETYSEATGILDYFHACAFIQIFRAFILGESPKEKAMV